jgi:hypothetical protein
MASLSINLTGRDLEASDGQSVAEASWTDGGNQRIPRVDDRNYIWTKHLPIQPYNVTSYIINTAVWAVTPYILVQVHQLSVGTRPLRLLKRICRQQVRQMPSYVSTKLDGGTPRKFALLTRTAVIISRSTRRVHKIACRAVEMLFYTGVQASCRC